MKAEVCRRLDEMEEEGDLEELKTVGQEIIRDENGKWPVEIVGDAVRLHSTLHLLQCLSFMSVDL